MLINFVNIHGTAHYQQEVETFEGRQWSVFEERVAADLMSARLRPVGQCGRPFKWHVLEA